MLTSSPAGASGLSKNHGLDRALNEISDTGDARAGEVAPRGVTGSSVDGIAASRRAQGRVASAPAVMPERARLRWSAGATQSCRWIQLMDAKKKTSVAARPSTERTACSLPHCSISMRLFEPAPAELMALSWLLIGRMAKNV
jgi:hypothetical protein